MFVRHHWDEDGSPLRSDEPGSQFKDVVEGEPDLLVTKRVNSAFHGDPDLERWLTDKEIEGIVVCGIETKMRCETTARVGDKEIEVHRCLRHTERRCAERTTVR